MADWLPSAEDLEEEARAAVAQRDAHCSRCAEVIGEIVAHAHSLSLAPHRYGADPRGNRKHSYVAAPPLKSRSDGAAEWAILDEPIYGWEHSWTSSVAAGRDDSGSTLHAIPVRAGEAFDALTIDQLKSCCAAALRGLMARHHRS